MHNASVALSMGLAGASQAVFLIHLAMPQIMDGIQMNTAQFL